MKKVLMAFVICLLFSVSVQAKEALKRINEIRYEACEEGVQDPRIRVEI